MKYKICDLVRVKPYNDIAKNYELKYDKEKDYNNRKPTISIVG